MSYSSVFYYHLDILAARPIGTLKRGGGVDPLTFNCSFLKKVLQNWELMYFVSRDDFSWEGGGTLPQNSYKPSKDL